MPHNNFNVRSIVWEEVHDLPDSWPDKKLRQLIELAEYDGDVADNELQDIAIMLLQDLKPRLAAELVLQVIFGDNMKPGVRQNIAEELQQDKPWDDFAVVTQQAGLFEAVVLLQRAFPTYFDMPDAVRITLDLEATNPEAAQWLRHESPTGPSKALLVRLLAAGMDEKTALWRLYDEELKGTKFSLAEGILWRVNVEPTSDEPNQRRVIIHSTHRWVADLQESDGWSCRAWPDK